MPDKTTLYGFDGSTYVRTVRMVMKDKAIGYDQVPVNVLAGEPRQADHLARHPFGKVPVLDIDGLRIRETTAICRYLEETRPEPPLQPGHAAGRARMNEAISLIDSYGYDALISACAYHLFPDFVGGKDDAAHAAGLANSKTLLALLMANKGADPWLAGAAPSLADYHLGPILFYSALTPDMAELSAVDGVGPWWERMQAHETFAATAPDLG